MADRFPLIANSSANQIQELASGDTLDLTGNMIDNCVNVKATGITTLSNTTDSTSSTTGALIISGGVGIAKNVYIGAGLSVAGTLTYEDVTNVDSVGLITAKSGVNVSGGQLVVGAGFSVGAAGVGTFAGNLVVNGNIDLEGDIDVNGTCEADAYTVAGTALDTHIAGVTVTNSTNSAHVYLTDNESTNENNLITFVENAESSTGNHGLEMDGDLTYTPALGRLTATQLAGTLQTAAQTNVTSLGTLTGLTVNGATSVAGGGELKVGTAVTISSTAGVSTFNADVIMTSADYPNKYAMWDRSDNAFKIGDSTSLKIGESGDLEIYHNGSHSFIDDAGTGNLYIRSGTDNGITLNTNADVILYFDNSAKFWTTNDGCVTTGIGTFTAGANFDGLLSEKFETTAGKLSDNTNIDLEDGMVHYFTTQESTTCTPNIRYNSSKSLNNMLTTGDCITVTVITTAAAGGYSANWNIDGSGITEEWVGGSAPSEGGADGHDIYTLNILKTANATYKVIVNVVNAT